MENSWSKSHFKHRHPDLLSSCGQWGSHLAFMPGLTSTVLSELATTRTNTSPASGWFCLFKYLFTRSSMYIPNRVDCSPTVNKHRSNISKPSILLTFQDERKEGVTTCLQQVKQTRKALELMIATLVMVYVRKWELKSVCTICPKGQVCSPGLQRPEKNTSETTRPTTKTTKLSLQENHWKTYAAHVQMEVIYIIYCPLGHKPQKSADILNTAQNITGKAGSKRFQIMNITAATISQLIH